MVAARRSWRPGTYQPQELHARINELLGVVQARAAADRGAGRLKAAEDGDELVVCVTEHLRHAASQLGAMEHALLMMHSDGAVS